MFVCVCKYVSPCLFYHFIFVNRFYSFSIYCLWNFIKTLERHVDFHRVLYDSDLGCTSLSLIQIGSGFCLFVFTCFIYFVVKSSMSYSPSYSVIRYSFPFVYSPINGISLKNLTSPPLPFGSVSGLLKNPISLCLYSDPFGYTGSSLPLHDLSSL